MHFTVIEARQPSTLTKKFTRSPDGQLIKTAAAYLSEGTANRHTVRSIEEFATTIMRLRTNEA